MPVRDALLRQIGVDGRGTHADQHGEIMHVQAFRRAHIHAGEGAERLAH